MKQDKCNMDEKSNQEYYSNKLFALKLKRAYEMASPRIQQYLEAEIQHVLSYIKPSDIVLELGCGYGRVLRRLSEKASRVVGIDIAENSLSYAKQYLSEYSNIELQFMTARNLTFEENSFDVVLGIQNAISAMKINPIHLINEALKVVKNNGTIIFSSYSEKIWEERLDWFVQQSKEGLLGEIDFKKTGNGSIVCKDGFKAKTHTINDFNTITRNLNLKANIYEVDESSIFCVIDVTHKDLD